jgi:hypothetical protein
MTSWSFWGLRCTCGYCPLECLSRAIVFGATSHHEPFAPARHRHRRIRRAQCIEEFERVTVLACSEIDAFEGSTARERKSAVLLVRTRNSFVGIVGRRRSRTSLRAIRCDVVRHASVRSRNRCSARIGLMSRSVDLVNEKDVFAPGTSRTEVKSRVCADHSKNRESCGEACHGARIS